MHNDRQGSYGSYMVASLYDNASSVTNCERKKVLTYLASSYNKNSPTQYANASMYTCKH